MVRHSLKFLILGFAVLHAGTAWPTAAPGVNPKSEAYKFQVWRSDAVAALAARTDANSLATAAALGFTNSYAVPSAAPAALQLFARSS